MPRALSPFLVTALLAVTTGRLASQTSALSPRPTLPSDSFPADSVGGASSRQAAPDDFFPDASPVTPGDSTALRELKAWIRHHPEMVAPPPERAVLVKV
jgi:hypothetical protein